jgi:hypothetical protein
MLLMFELFGIALLRGDGPVRESIVSEAIPTDNEVNVLVCDDVRLEMNKKLTLVGFYAGRSINAANIGPQFTVPLAFLFLFSGGEGKFSMRFEIKAPSGNKIVEDAPQIEKVKNATAIHVIKILHFPLVETGTYRFDIYLGTKLYSRPFAIGHDPSLLNVTR